MSNTEIATIWRIEQMPAAERIGRYAAALASADAAVRENGAWAVYAHSQDIRKLENHALIADALKPLLSDPIEKVRFWAVNALPRVAEQTVAAPLMFDALEDPATEVWMAAANGIVEVLGIGEAGQNILQSIRTDGRLGESQAYAPLTLMLESGDQSLRTHVGAVFAAASWQEACMGCVELLTHPDSVVRAFAVFALERSGSQPIDRFYVPLGLESSGIITGLLTSEDAKVRACAVGILAGVLEEPGSDNLLDFMSGMLMDSSSVVRERATHALEIWSEESGEGEQDN